MRFADLHLHTNLSDGTLTPEDLVRQSKEAGLDSIAIVDHDTVSAIEPALREAAKTDLEVIPGVELTAEHEKSEIHILGYFIDYNDRLLLEELAALRKNREDRIYSMLDKLKVYHGIDIDPKSIFRDVKGGTVGRLHIAKALIENKHASCVYEAFDKYIGDKSAAYVANFKLSPQQAIDLIRKTGGISVLAHPYVIKNDELILDFIGFGLRGIEVFYPEHSQSMINFYSDLAEKHGLLLTGGSDFHGSAKPEVKLGTVKLPYSYVEKLKLAKKEGY